MVVKQGSPMLASDITDLTFFPIGTILMYDGTNWTDGRGGWYICNAANKAAGRTPDLSDKFIKGNGSKPATGDGQTTLSLANLPPHSHSHKFDTGVMVTGTSAFLALTPSPYWGNGHTSNTNSTGNGQPFDVLPSYYSLIYIRKCV